MSWSLQAEALVNVLGGDARADEAAVRARRIMGIYLLGLVVCLAFGSVGGILAGDSWEYGS